VAVPNLLRRNVLSDKNNRPGAGIVFRKPEIRDGKRVHEIARASKTLDVNSVYHYLLLCRCFADTSMVAEKQGRVIGFCTAFTPPAAPDTVFVWQVAVDQKERGQGVGVRILVEIINNLRASNIRYLDATITPSNTASIRLFTAAAKKLNAPFTFDKVFFSAADFGENAHESEKLFHIGPIDSPL
jgi:L-2,4-diaminobutyric acid acetyltransferase